MKVFYLLAASALFMSIGFAQGLGSGGTIGGDRSPRQMACPDRGVMLIPANDIASDAGQNCGHGIAFEYGGVTYTPDDDRCPTAIESTPSYKVPDTATVQDGLRPVEFGTIDVTRREYECVGIGCGFLFLEGCCEEQGEEVVNTFKNWDVETCAEVVIEAGPTATTFDS